MGSDAADDPHVQQPASRCTNENRVSASIDLSRYASRILSPGQRVALELLLQGEPDAQIAKQLGIDRSTVYRWRMSHPAFRRELERLRQIIWKQQADRLRALVSPALDVIQQHLADPRTSLRAAAIIMRQTAPRAADPPDPQGQRRDARREFDRALDAYIMGPAPGAMGRGVSIGDEDDEDEDMEESED